MEKTIESVRYAEWLFSLLYDKKYASTGKFYVCNMPSPFVHLFIWKLVQFVIRNIWLYCWAYEFKAEEKTSSSGDYWWWVTNWANSNDAKVLMIAIMTVISLVSFWIQVDKIVHWGKHSGIPMLPPVNVTLEQVTW